jgi:hypothetical protein
MKQIPESPFNGAEERILTQRGMPILSTRQWYSECPDCKQIRTGQTQVLGYGAAERVCVKTLLSPPGDPPPVGGANIPR